MRRDKSTQELVAALVEAAGMPQPEGRERCLVVCVAGHQNAAAQVAELADLARDRSEESFFSELGKAHQALQSRYDHLRDMVQAAEPHTGDVSAWQLLRQLRVLMVRFEPSDEEDWAALLSELEVWSRDQTSSSLSSAAQSSSSDGSNLTINTRSCRSSCHADTSPVCGSAAWTMSRRWSYRLCSAWWALPSSLKNDSSERSRARSASSATCAAAF